MFQLCQKLAGGDVAPPRFGAVQEGLGVQVVRVHQAGIEHPGIKGDGEAVPSNGGAADRPGESNFLLPLAAELHLPLEPSQQGGGGAGVCFCTAVWQTAVVPGYRESNLQLSLVERDFSSGCGVVHSLAALQPPLKAIAAFSNVVEQPCQPGLLLAAKGLGECLGPCRRT